jgi:hypothetical protein
MSQRTDIYTLTGKKIGVIKQAKPEQYTLTGIKIESTDKKETASNNFDKDPVILKK